MSFKFQAGCLVLVGVIFGLVSFVQAEGTKAETGETVAIVKTDKDDPKVTRAELLDGQLAIRNKAAAARAEERALREKIRNAEKMGETEKVRQLEEQLRTLHAENVRKLEEDRKNLQQSWKGLRSDGKAARKMGVVMTEDSGKESDPGDQHRGGKESRKVTGEGGDSKGNPGQPSQQKTPMIESANSATIEKKENGKNNMSEGGAQKSSLSGGNK